MIDEARFPMRMHTGTLYSAAPDVGAVRLPPHMMPRACTQISVVGDESGAWWVAADGRHGCGPHAVQRILHAHLLVAPQAHQPRDRPSQGAPVPRVPEQPLCIPVLHSYLPK